MQSSFQVLLLVPILFSISLGQEQRNTKEEIMYNQAVTELDAVLTRSESIRDTRKFLAVRSKAANLLWLRNVEDAKEIFRKLWTKIDTELDDPAFDKEAARIDLLSQIYPRDAKFAYELTDSLPNEKKSESASLTDKVLGSDRDTARSAFLAYRIAEDDVRLAATIVEQTMIDSTAPSLPIILARIRLTDPILANAVAGRILERVDNQPPTIALSTLGCVAAFIFPYSPSPVFSSSARESDDSLRLLFTQYALATLRRSVLETDEVLRSQGYTDQVLRIRRFNQAITCSLLVVLTQRYLTASFPEVNALSVTLNKSLPPGSNSMIAAQTASARGILGQAAESEVADAEIIAAIAREDFTRAELLIGQVKDERQKRAWFNIMYRAMANVQLKKGDMAAALNTARKIDDVPLCLPIFLTILKTATGKKDEEISLKAYNEILAQAEKQRIGLQAKTLFGVVFETAKMMKEQSFTALRDSISNINSLSEIKAEQTRRVSYRGEAFWDDPDNFLSSSAMLKAFAVAGEIDLDETLLAASRFRDNALQYVARLSSVEKILKKGPPKKASKTKKSTTE